MTLELAFGLLGAITLLGFAGSLLFERTQIPDLMVLILIGILLGPVLGLLTPAQLAPITPYFATLAMIIILFEGGLGLNLRSIMRGAASGFVFAAATFAASMGAVAAVCLLFGYELRVGLLLGAIAGGTSGAIVLPILTRLSASEESKGVLAIESALTDILCLVTALSLIGMLSRTQPAPETDLMAALGANFSVGVAVGLGGGVAWLKLLPVLEHYPLSYMLTLAALFLLYTATEVLGGSGAMACLSFGLVLGNSRLFQAEAPLLSEIVRRRLLDFHSEIAFLVRTFFFVYIGLIFDVARATLGALLLAAAAFAAIAAARWACVAVFTWLKPERRGERTLLLSMMARGLAAAVLAPLPLAAGVPQSAYFNEVVLMLILLSNLALTGGAFLLSLRRRAAAARPIAEPAPAPAEVRR